MEIHKAGFPPFPHSLEIPSDSHITRPRRRVRCLGATAKTSRNLNSNPQLRKRLVTDVPGPKCNGCSGTLTLKTAVQQSMAENGDPGSFCDGQVLKNRYVGPSFSESDWGLITRSYVRQDGYAFMIFCPEQGGYRISAIPQRVKADGTHFCADESGNAGCTKDQSFHVTSP